VLRAAWQLPAPAKPYKTLISLGFVSLFARAGKQTEQKIALLVKEVFFDNWPSKQKSGRARPASGPREGVRNFLGLRSRNAKAVKKSAEREEALAGQVFWATFFEKSSIEKKNKDFFLNQLCSAVCWCRNTYLKAEQTKIGKA